MSESIFDTLPDELVEFILAKADVDDILGFLQVATRFRQIILQSTHLQYLIELAADGLEDGSSSELCFADRLQALRQRRAARATLEPTARRTVTCDGTGRRVAFGSHLVWYRAETSEICILQIPSVFRAIPEKEWTVQGPSVTGELLHSLTIDPNQDLLVTLIVGQDGQKLGIRSLSTGGHHPVAATPILYIDRVPWEESEFKVEEIYVSNNYLGFRLVFGDHRWVMKEQIMVYDWTSGRHILSVSQEAARAGIGFTFLTDQYLLLVYSGTQDDNYEFKFVLSVIDMNSLPSGNTTEMVISELQPTCSLLLPLLPAVPPSPIEINVNTHHPWHTTHMRLPFLCPSDDRLVAITLSWSRLTTRLHTILDFVARAKSDPAKRVFGWDEWGKDRCRLVEDRFKESASVSGMSMLLPEPCISTDERARRSKRFYLCNVGHLAAQKHVLDWPDSVSDRPLELWRPSHRPRTRLPTTQVLLPSTVLHHPDGFGPSRVYVGEDCVIVLYRFLPGSNDERIEYHVLSF